MEKETRTNFEFIKCELAEIKESLNECHKVIKNVNEGQLVLQTNFTNHLMHHKEETSRNRWIFGAIMVVISIVVAIIVRVI